MSLRHFTEASFGKYSFCKDCDVELSSLWLHAKLDLVADGFNMTANMWYKHPCRLGDVAGGSAFFNVAVGDLMIKNFTVLVRHYCGVENSLQIPGWTFEGYATSPIQIAAGVVIERLEMRVSLYEDDGATFAAGSLVGHVSADTAGVSARLGVPAGLRALPSHPASAGRGNWGVHTHRVFAHLPRAKHLQHPTAENGMVVSLTASLGDRVVGPDHEHAHLAGIKVKSTFMFDTRTDPMYFGAAVEVAFQAGCVNITASVVADNACDPAKPMTLSGVVLIDCGAMVGEGRVSGAKWCNDGDVSHPLYRVRAEIPMLSLVRRCRLNTSG